MTEETIGLSEEIREQLLQRLRRIEGQAQGVQRMIEQGRDCRDILAQLNSIRSAAYGASLLLMKHHALECLRHSGGKPADQRQEELEEMIGLMLRLPH